MKTFLLESHQKNCWFVDLWSDGSIELFSTYRRRYNRFHRLIAGSGYQIHPGSLPKYVVAMVEEAEELWAFLKQNGEI